MPGLLGEALLVPQASCWSNLRTTWWWTWVIGGLTPHAAAGLGAVSASALPVAVLSAEPPAVTTHSRVLRSTGEHTTPASSPASGGRRGPGHCAQGDDQCWVQESCAAVAVVVCTLQAVEAVLQRYKEQLRQDPVGPNQYHTKTLRTSNDTQAVLTRPEHTRKHT